MIAIDHLSGRPDAQRTRGKSICSLTQCSLTQLKTVEWTDRHSQTHGASVHSLGKRDIGTVAPDLRGRLTVVTKAQNVIARRQVRRHLHDVQDALHRRARDAVERRWEGGCVGISATVVAAGAIRACGFGTGHTRAWHVPIRVLLVVTIPANEHIVRPSKQRQVGGFDGVLYSPE